MRSSRTTSVPQPSSRSRLICCSTRSRTRRSFEVTEEAFNEYLNKLAEDVKATADQLKNYFGEAFIKAEQLKEMATNLIVDSAKVKAAEAEEKPKKASKPKAPKAEDKAEETEAAAEEPKAE